MADFNCDYCGDTFYRPPSKVDRNANKFCSPRCKCLGLYGKYKDEIDEHIYKGEN